MSGIYLDFFGIWIFIMRFRYTGCMMYATGYILPRIHGCVTISAPKLVSWINRGNDRPVGFRVPNVSLKIGLSCFITICVPCLDCHIIVATNHPFLDNRQSSGNSEKWVLSPKTGGIKLIVFFLMGSICTNGIHLWRRLVRTWGPHGGLTNLQDWSSFHEIPGSASVKLRTKDGQVLRMNQDLPWVLHFLPILLEGKFWREMTIFSGPNHDGVKALRWNMCYSAPQVVPEKFLPPIVT